MNLTVRLSDGSWKRVRDAFLAGELLGDGRPVTQARMEAWLKEQLVIRVTRHETENERKKIQIGALG